MFHRLSFLLVLFLAACAARGELRYEPAAAEIGAIQRIFVGTTREEDPERRIFTAGRDPTPQFARYDISVPPDRELGTLPWPPRHGPADPRKVMLTTDSQTFADANAFRRALTAEMTGTRRGTREAVVFIHGFNNNFAEGLNRFAQLYHDMRLPGVAVHYSWPSRASIRGYAYDRDSVLFARDGLDELLHQVTDAGAERIILVAHSLGGHLLMEALRQMTLHGDAHILRRLGGIVLISPDIDIDVFRSQARTVGKLPQPFVIFTSARDRALRISAVVAGESSRLGNVADVEQLAGLGVTLLEVGDLSTGTGHFTLGNSPALLSLIGNAESLDAALSQDEQGRVGLLSAAVLTVQGATRIILSPVAKIGEGLDQ